jgi:putative DNA primase/helicase
MTTVEDFAEAAKRRQAEAAPAPDDQRPAIDIIPGQLAKRTAEAIRVLRDARTDIYDRGGQLVRPVRVAEPEMLDGVRRPVGALVLRPVEPEWLRLRLAEVAAWRKWDARTETLRPADPPADVARTIVAAPDEGGWPYLRAIVRHPVLLPDGRRIQRQGYDAATGLLVDATGDWPSLPDKPTRDHAVEARARIEYLLRYYPWVSPVDRAVALSLILTALARAVVPAAPGHGTDAPTPGSGKSLLIDAAAILSTGAPAAVMDYGRDQDEAAKRLDGMLLAGDAVISVDNIEVAIGGAALCQTLSQPTRRVRPLGASTMVTVPCGALIALTGNNLTLLGDIVRRVLVCRLDAGCERPELREIPQDLLADVREQRGELVRDAQIIMAAYIAAGRPRQTLPPLGGYREWNTMVRAPLVWCGAADPVAAMERTRAEDPSQQATRAVLEVWHDAIGSEPITVASLIASAEARAQNGARDLWDALAMVAMRGTQLDGGKLGYWLRSHRDCRCGARTMRRAAGTDHSSAARWQVLSTPSSSAHRPQQNQRENAIFGHKRASDADDTDDSYPPARENHENKERKGEHPPHHPYPPSNGSAERHRIGSCVYCRDAAYSDDAATLTSGGVLHHRCTSLWSRQRTSP